MSAIDLGWCVAVLRTTRETKSLHIMSPSASDSDGYTPAESATVYGAAGLKALRDALNEAFPPERMQQ